MFDSTDPDSRFAHLGPDGLGDAELLAFLLTRGGAPGDHAVNLAREVLRGVGGLIGLREARQGQLEAVVGVGPAKARRLAALGALAVRIAERPIARGALVDSPRVVWEALRGRCLGERSESFWVLSLDGRGRKLGLELVARGGGNFVHIEVADVFRGPLLEGAAAVIVAHNHPSGDPNPSAEDLSLTERLCAAGELLGIQVRDHVILGDGCYCSLAETGELPDAPLGFRGSAAERG